MTTIETQGVAAIEGSRHPGVLGMLGEVTGHVVHAVEFFAHGTHASVPANPSLHEWSGNKHNSDAYTAPARQRTATHVSQTLRDVIENRHNRDAYPDTIPTTFV